jgi:TonB family protein
MDLALKGLDLRRPVGADKVRVISLGPAKSDALYTDPYGRKWQERVWAVPFVDVYLVGELLPTPDGYAAIIEMSPSLTLPEVLGTARLLAGQLDVSYSGSLTQWRAALNRRSLLPAALSEVKLEATPMWTLKTPRFVSAVPPDVLALTDKSPMMLTMGFMSQGSQTASWDIQGVLWDQDDRKDAAVQLQRYVRPPDSAKAELRNRFDSIWQRRSPYDATLSREAVDTYAVSSVLDVPGRKASTVSADLEYGLTVYLVEHPSSAKAAAAMARTTDVTHVLEHSVGEDVTRESRSSLTSGTAPSGAIPSRSVPSGATASAVMMDEFERTELGVAAGLDKELGKDPRGRVMSDDLRAWMAALRTEKPVNASETETAAWWREQMANFVYFQTYWKQVPALVHNRDMFAVFLERNYLPVNRPHEAAVIEAERALLASLSTEHPSPEWPLRENQLRAAYVQERSALIKTLFAKWSTATPLHPRTSACPPPETTTSGTPHPAIGSNTRSLESLWPLESRQLGEEGTVMASLRISATGCVTAMNIVGSSGSDLMDQAVLKFLESQSFKPAAADGRPVESSAMLPIVFKLQN